MSELLENLSNINRVVQEKEWLTIDYQHNQLLYEALDYMLNNEEDMALIDNLQDRYNLMKEMESTHIDIYIKEKLGCMNLIKELKNKGFFYKLMLFQSIFEDNLDFKYTQPQPHINLIHQLCQRYTRITLLLAQNNYII